jgi:hypothetical protein
MLAEVRGAGRPGVSRWRRGLCLSKQFAKRRSLKNARVPPPLSPVYLSVLQRPAALSSCRRVRGPAVGMWVGWAWAMRRAGRGREGREAGSAAVRAHTTPLRSLSLFTSLPFAPPPLPDRRLPVAVSAVGAICWATRRPRVTGGTIVLRGREGERTTPERTR